MTILVTLFEHRPISYSLGKKEDYNEVRHHLTLSKDTLNALDQLNESVKFLEISRSVITPQNFVGVVKTEHLTFQIFPKLFDDSQLESHIDVIAGNLLQMLSYSGNLTTPDIDISSLSTEDTDLFEIFIYIFAKKLNELIRLTQKKQYIERYEELRFIKGRIDIRNYGNPARLHIIPCDYYDFTIDNLLNQVLKYTCYAMARNVQSFDTVRLLKEIVNILDGVTLTPVTSHEIDRITFTRLNQQFEPFIRICQLYLSHSTIVLRAADTEIFSFLIPMEKLFEQFIAGVLSEEPAYYFGSNVQVDTQYRIGPIVYTQLNKPLFHLIPDIVVTDGLHKIIIDTKYKRLKQEERKKGVISNDVYQMHAYVSKKDADSCMLLYPEIDYKDAVNFEFRMKEGTIEEKKVPFYIGSIKLTHKLTDPKGWNNFRKELSLLMRQMMIRTNLPDNSAKPIPSK